MRRGDIVSGSHRGKRAAEKSRRMGWDEGGTTSSGDWVGKAQEWGGERSMCVMHGGGQKGCCDDRGVFGHYWGTWAACWGF